MNIVSRVTVKHLRQNRKRTAVTILGIMLSVALITAISAFAESFLDMMRQSEIVQDGEWHVQFYDVDKEKLSAIEEDGHVDKASIVTTVGTAVLPDGENEYKPYLLVQGFDPGAMEEFPTTLMEGRYPESADEIVLPEHLKSNGGVEWKVGDTIQLEMGTRVIHDQDGDREAPAYYGLEPDESLEDTHHASYKVVGIIERPHFESYNQASYTAITYLDTSALDGTEKLEVSVKVKSLNKSLYSWADGLAASLDVECGYNTSLLSYYLLSGNNTIVSMLTRVKWVMMLIVAAGSVAVIYSSFSISISERSRYLGMLASVGATKKQKRNSVFTEAAILGAIGIPLGLLLGFAGVFVTTQCIQGLVNGMYGMEGVTMQVIISWPGILGAVILAAATILLSAWIPARRASRITPVEAIRQNKDVKLSAKQVKTSKLTRALFGFEGELALKNLKRNKKRYRATVLSLVFSIALYLSVASFTAYLKGAYRMQLGVDSSKTPDISVTLYPDEEKDQENGNDEMIDQIRSMGNITEFASAVSISFSYYLDDGNVIKEDIREKLEEGGSLEIAGEDVGPYVAGIRLIGMDDASLREFAARTGADEERLFDTAQNGVILINKRNDVTNGRSSWKESWSLKTGDSVTGSFFKTEGGDGAGNYKESLGRLGFTVAGITDQLPLGGYYDTDFNSMCMYTTVENAVRVGKELYGADWTNSSQVYLRTDNHDALRAELKNMADEGKNIFVYSLVEERKTINDMLLLVNVFVYGFIILTALICVTSIFNTISTSMALRRREYAMLKSVGMDPARFGRMVAYESVFYGLKALLYGLPIGLILMYGIYMSIASAIATGFYIIWGQVAVAVVCVMAVVGLTMWYSSRKIKKANIVDVLKDENI
ncbi:FtsX-like permease family protein [Lacrimispora sp. NSJ-141]|uniref:FtsX-like permease family protein n=1 Tax=Lientehia hominis TaxID=2897778 RepID=A0AAP2RK50_9FIRM|nr:FtsX-like permease family protein [Lientehia hominis]MCD2492873.1 FtsX-like permease family protein [Lientehia hominis]